MVSSAMGTQAGAGVTALMAPAPLKYLLVVETVPALSPPSASQTWMLTPMPLGADAEPLGCGKTARSPAANVRLSPLSTSENSAERLVADVPSRPTELRIQ